MSSARFILFAAIGLLPPAAGDAGIPVDLSHYRGDCGVLVQRETDRLAISWPTAASGPERGRLVIDLRRGAPLIASLGVQQASTDVREILRAIDPVTFVTVGTRRNPPDRPPRLSVFDVFFDSPAQRPHRTFQARLEPSRATVVSRKGRATVAVDGLSAGPFSGGLELTVYAGTPLIQIEAVLSTNEPDRAYLYDAGLVSAEPGWERLAWHDTDGHLRKDNMPAGPDVPRAVRHRAIAVEVGRGSIACFPPPHQYFFPRDSTENQKTVWYGRGHRSLEGRAGFGVRQTERGGGNFSPWFNAPPGTEQRLGVFYLISPEPAGDTLAQALRFTHADRFPDLPGHVTLTSHWHLAVAEAASRETSRKAARTMPDFVRMFRDMNVNIVHLAEFHGDGHPRDSGPLRLPELETLFQECRRLSEGPTLFLPGEEANADLAGGKPGVKTGHWLYLFPRPVYWTMTRRTNQPFREDDPKRGPVYHVGDRDDMAELLRQEHGLAWTAHPRIKSSNWTPDAYKDDDFFRSPQWLGAAWKAMPADLSEPRLGRRALDLLDDMANWGRKKYVLGEVDVFKLDHTHELYGHMNVNYLALDRAPEFKDDWSPVLDALRGGRFFVTTGEVLLPGFTVAGKPAGATLRLPSGGVAEVVIDLQWTFPMQFAEVISGDGRNVYRERIDLSETSAFGRGRFKARPNLSGRTWVRVEAWDVAANGVFSQPVWIEPGT